MPGREFSESADRYLRLVLVLLTLSVLPVYGGSATLETYQAAYRAVDDERDYDGVVEAVYRSTVSAQTDGEIVELPFDVNDFVPKGALIVRIDDTRQKAERDKAAADEVKAAARLKEAESNYQRNLRLIKENAVSASQLDKSEADVKSARAQLKQARAVLEQAQEQLDYTRVTAPYDGVVVERLVELGERVQVGTPLGTGLSLEKLRVKVEVPARMATQVRDLTRARVHIPDGRMVDTDSLTFFPYADADSHTFSVRVDLPEGQYGLYPGMLARVGFVVGEQKQLAVPTRAIVHRSEVTGVYVLDEDQTVRFRQLRIGRQLADDMTLVLAGLSEGEQVAVDPVAAVIRLKQQAGSIDE